MCGIAGFVDSRASPDARQTIVEKMCGAMIHRGPDDSGVISQGDATLGMRRLAIFDPANGHQPMQSPDGRYTLVFNGAIYNFRALRDELAGAHWTFRTQCDTEVLLAAFVRWGEACLGRLRGMFAFAVWDEREQSLFLARDPFGIKPLYYRHEVSRVMFASELNALVTSKTFAVEIDVVAVSDYLGWLAVPAPRTIYRDVYSLRPGECATFAAGQLNVHSAWDFGSSSGSGGTGPNACATRDEFIRELRARLEDTIRAHVVADVPVGAFLSGGLDSTVIVALMTRLTGKSLRTFSIGFEEPGYSEANAAEATARHLGTVHQTYTLTGSAVARDLGALLSAMDQPTGDGINTYYASRVARAGGVTVALSGLGGDEVFGGYPSFRDLPKLARWLPVWRRVPERVRAAVIARLHRGDTRRRKLGDFLQRGRNLNELCALQRRVFSDAARQALLAPAVSGDATVAERSPFHPELAALTNELRTADVFSTITAWELRTYMADVLLRDSDVMSMRHSLELRVPFVDRPLIEWLRVQSSQFVSTSDHPKSVLAEATRDVLPPGQAERPKQGFTLPFPVWMKRELRPFLAETFSDASIDRSGLFSRVQVQQLWQGFLARDDHREWSRVWSLAMLVAFVNRR